VATLNISLNAAGAKQQADAFSAALRNVTQTAGGVTSAVTQVSQALRQVQAAYQQAQQSAFQQISMLQQQAAVQRQVLSGAISLAEGERKLAEAEIFAATGSRQLAQSLAAVQQEFRNNQQSISQMGQSVQQNEAQLRSLSSAGADASLTFSQLARLLTGLSIAGAIAAAVATVKNLVEEGIRYNATLEQSRIGIASIIAATNSISDAQGKTLEGAQKFNAAQTLASGLMQQIQQDALKTTATTEQLVEAFQQALGPLSAAGLSLNQSREATLRIVQAASALGVLMNQVAQEVRAIAEGSIDVNARLAKALGITNEQVKAQREQGTLFQFIVAQTESFAAAGDQTAKSFQGITSSIRDVSSQILGLTFAGPFEQLKTTLQGVLDLLQNIKTTMAAGEIAETGQRILGLQQEYASLTETLAALQAQQRTPLEKMLGIDPSGAIQHRLADIAAEVADLSTRYETLTGTTDQYSTAARQAADAVNKLADAQVKAREAATQDIAERERAVAILQKAIDNGNSLAQAQALITETNLAVKTGSVDLAQKEGALAAQEAALKDVLKDREEATKKEADEQARLAEAQAKARAELSAQLGVYQQVAAGTLTLEEAQRQLAIQQLATKVGSASLAKQYIDESNAAKDLAKADELIAKNADELQRIRNQEARSIADVVSQTQQSTQANLEEASIIQQGIAAGRNYDDVLRDLAIHHAEVALSAKGVTENVHGLAVAQVDAAGAAREQRQALDDLQNSAIHVGDIAKQAIQGLAQGTLELKNFFRQTGSALIADFAATFLLGKKQKLDIPFSANMLGLVGPGGLIGDILSAGGSLAAQAFASGFNGVGAGAQVTQGLTQGGGALANVSTIFTSVGGQAAQAFASGFSGAGVGAQVIRGLAPSIGAAVAGPNTIFQSAGAQASGVFGSAFFTGLGQIFSGNFSGGFNSIFGTGIGGGIGAGLLGFGAGNIFSKVLGLSGSEEARIGGQVASTIGGIIGFAVGGPLGSFLGSFGGDILGNLIGGLFVHIPTKGTQVRKAVVDYLKDIGATFASEINSKNYFFEETKTLAQQMFGGDFLAASEQILKDKAGPELAKQLQALGTFLTADQASKLGKSVEQTGTTFGTLLIANLGIDRIPAAIDEIVQKGQISFAGLMDKLTSVFQAGKISADFYRASIEGAISLFTKDLPVGIDVAQLALDSFTKDSIFSLQLFQDKLTAVVQSAKDISDALTNAITQGIAGNQSRVEVELAFKANLQQVIRDALVAKTIAEGLADVFKDIDLSKPLDPATVDILTGRVGVLYDNVHAVLDAANALPGAFADAADEAAHTSAALAQAAMNATDIANKQGDGFADAIRSAASSAIQDGIKNGASGADIGAAFTESLHASIADAITNAVITGFVNAALTGGALGPALQSITDLINQLVAGKINLSTFGDKVQDAFAAAGPAIDQLAAGLGIAGTELRRILKDAGLLKDTVAEGAVDWIALNKQFEESRRATHDVGQVLAGNIEATQRWVDASGQLTEPMRLALISAGATTEQIDALQNNLKATNAQTLVESLQSVLSTLGLTNPQLDAIRAALEAAGLGGGTLGAVMQDILTSAGLTTSQVDAVRAALTAAGLAGGDINAALQSTLTAAGLSASAIDEVKLALENAGLSASAISESLQKIAASAGLSDESLAKLKASLGDAASGADATNTGVEHIDITMRDVLLQSLGFNTSLIDAEASAGKIVGTTEKMADAGAAYASALQDALDVLKKIIQTNEVIAAQGAAQVIVSTPPKQLAGGGLVGGSGTGDSVPAMLDPREYVMPPAATKANFQLLEQLKAGMVVRHFAAGGLVGPAAETSGAAGTQSIIRLYNQAIVSGNVDLQKSLEAMGVKASKAATSVNDLAKQIEELIKRRFAITTSLANQLAQVGAISQTQAIKTGINIINQQLGPLLAKFAASAKLTVDQLKEAEDLTGQLRDATVSRYQAEVEEIQKVHDAFKSASDAVKSALQNVMKQGVTPAAGLSQLQVQAAALRQQLQTATLAHQPGLIQDLAQTLQDQFQAAQQVFSPTDQRLVVLRESLIAELLTLQGTAEQGVQDTTSAITDMRTAVVSELQSLASQQDAIAARQQSVLQAQLDQLTQINKTPTGPPGGPQHGPQHRTISAQGGYEGRIYEPTEFLTHPNEYVSIRPAGATEWRLSGSERVCECIRNHRECFGRGEP
jgi:hypothetical protein